MHRENIVPIKVLTTRSVTSLNDIWKDTLLLSFFKWIFCCCLGERKMLFFGGTLPLKAVCPTTQSCHIEIYRAGYFTTLTRRKGHHKVCHCNMQTAAMLRCHSTNNHLIWLHLFSNHANSSGQKTQDESLHAGSDWERLTFGISASGRLGRGAMGWNGVREAGGRHYVSLLGGTSVRAGLLLDKPLSFKHTSFSVSWKNKE